MSKIKTNTTVLVFNLYILLFYYFIAHPAKKPTKVVLTSNNKAIWKKQK